jgi:putative peptidoglycan lipid II flippase
MSESPLQEPVPAGPGSSAAEAVAPPSDGSRLVRASALVAVLALAWKIIGVVRESIVAALFGANRAMDAFVVAKSVPDMVSTWIEMPIRSAIVPLFTRTLHAEGEDAAWRAASNVLNTLAITLCGVVVALFLGADLIVRLLSTGFDDPAAWSQSAQLSQILVPSILFSVMAVVLGSISNVYHRQAIPALGRNLNALVVLAVILVLGPRLGLTAYAWGILAGSVVYFAVQLDVIWSHRRYYRFVFQPRAPEIREVVALALPLFIGLSGTRIDVFLDRNFASFLPAGSLSILVYATMLSALVTDFALTVASSVLLPHFAHLAATGRHEDLKRRIGQSIGAYLFLMVPATVFLCAGARPVVDLVYGRGEFTPENAALTASVLMILALADPAFGVGQILAQVYIGGGDTRTPMVVGFWRVGVKVAISAALIAFLGIYALALATAISSFARTAMLWRRLPHAVRPSGSDLATQLRGLVLPAFGAVAAVLLVVWLVPPEHALVRQFLRAGLAFGAAAVVYLALAFATGFPLAGELLRRLRALRGAR